MKENYNFNFLFIYMYIYLCGYTRTRLYLLVVYTSRYLYYYRNTCERIRTVRSMYVNRQRRVVFLSLSLTSLLLRVIDIFMIMWLHKQQPLHCKSSIINEDILRSNIRTIYSKRKWILMANIKFISFETEAFQFYRFSVEIHFFFCGDN